MRWNWFILYHWGGYMRLGSLKFFGLFTLGLVGQARIASLGKGTKTSSFPASLILSIFACWFVAQARAVDINGTITEAQSEAVQITTTRAGPEDATRTKAAAEDLETCRQAAEKGDAAAQVTLGKLYESGQGVTKDLREAVKWYREAAENGMPRGSSSLVGVIS